MSTINLLPGDYLRQRRGRRVNLVFLVLFSVVVSSVFGAYVVTSRSKNHTLEVRDRVNAEYAEGSKLIQHMQTLEFQKEIMLAKAQLISSLVERVPRSTLLAAVTNARPDNTSLLRLDLKTDRAKRMPGPVGQLSPTGNSVLTSEPRAATRPPIMVRLIIKGLAGTDTEVAKFIAALAHNPLVESVDLAYSREKTIGAKTNREFEVELYLKYEADAIDMVDSAAADRADSSGGVAGAREENS